MNMKRCGLVLMGLVVALALHAQNFKELWITGSAVPGGIQKLVMVTDNDFKYAGELKAGELKIITTKKVGKKTMFLSPVMPAAEVVNHGMAYTVSDNANAPAWQVVVGDEHYRFHLYTDEKKLHGEIFKPWGELFIGGGATDSGWKEGKMQLMNQQLENPYIWVWEGELKRHDGVEEPTSFKFQGQNRWYPKALHPYIQGTDILTEQRFRTNGPDNKWMISKNGVYRITVDLFNENVKAEFIR